jgi:hypothetical protein
VNTGEIMLIELEIEANINFVNSEAKGGVQGKRRKNRFEIVESQSIDNEVIIIKIFVKNGHSSCR